MSFAFSTNYRCAVWKSLQNAPGEGKMQGGRIAGELVVGLGSEVCSRSSVAREHKDCFACMTESL